MSLLRLRVLCLSALLVALVTVPSCTCGHSGAPCALAIDCAPGEICLAGTCQTTATCAQASDCPAGQVCLSGACAPAGGSCTSNSACPSGLVCTQGACEPMSCTHAIDCGAGAICAGGECVPPGGTLPLLPDGGIASNPDGGCINLECAQVTCADGGTTTVMGSVFDPSGQVPLYNAVVYVPNGDVQPFTAGVTCDRCGTFTTGNPLVIALTDATGSFTLQNVPTGVQLPLVYQIGKWRRRITLPTVPACTTQTLTDVNQQRLPKNRSEGDIPQMAIATGSADPFECLLLKMGIDTGEFTLPTQPGRVHMFATPASEKSGNAPPMQLNGGSPAASTLWSDAGTLGRYDVVLLPCEGGEYKKPDAGIDNLVTYTSSGGRLFVTHYSYVWTALRAPFNQTANWVPDPAQNNNPPDPFNVTVDTSFPKGQAFSDWLSNIGALSNGKLPVHESRDDVGAVNLDAGTRWLYGPNPNNTTTPVSTQHLTFNTPISPPALPDGGAGIQCGRVVFSDFHVTANELANNNGVFPGSCKTGTMDSQEKALVFMLFDVSSCVQSDQIAPTVCPGAGQSCSTSSPCCNGLTCVDPASQQPCATGSESCICRVVLN